jgi:hypothetical protein
MKNPFLQIKLSAISMFVLLFLAMTATMGSAFVPEDLVRLKKEKNCPGCDLRSADLRDLNLFDANLEGANLMGANLENVNLEHATLDDAGLEKANLKSAIIKNASMDHATLEETITINANFEGTVWIDGRICKPGSIGSCK